MSNFDFISQKNEYKAILPLLLEAETGVDPADTAIKCRKALGGLIAFIYEKLGIDMLKSASMLELIDGKIITDFADNSVLLNSLHLIRIVGINAEHGSKVTQKQAKLALDNLVFFTEFVQRKFDAPKSVEEIVLPKYMSEADTRKIYIDTYLREVGWEIC